MAKHLGTSSVVPLKLLNKMDAELEEVVGEIKKMDAKLEEVVEEIKKVVEELLDVDRQLKAIPIGDNKTYLWKEKERLGKREEHLREEKLLLQREE
jgi:septal ring factor EnvC (AmiA/AmiB activator)